MGEMECQRRSQLSTCRPFARIYHDGTAASGSFVLKCEEIHHDETKAPTCTCRVYASLVCVTCMCLSRSMVQHV